MYKYNISSCYLVLCKIELFVVMVYVIWYLIKCLYDYSLILLEVKRGISYDILCSNVFFVKIEVFKNVKIIEI